MSVTRKMKEWYSSIEAQKFEGISAEITEVLLVPNLKYNHQIDSLLARLTHAYMKHSESKRDDIKTGLEVYTLTCCLCDRFSESSNPPRLRSGIFHITRCLRELHLYKESKILCDYVKPGKLFTPDSSDSEYFFKLSYAWRQSAETLIKSLSTEFDQKTYNTLLDIIKYDFELLKYSENNGSYSQTLFTRFQRYIDKITAPGMNWNQNNIEAFFLSIIEHIKKLQNNSTLEIDSLLIYNEIIDIMHCLSLRFINTTKICEVLDLIKNLSKEFEVFLEKDPQSQKCLQLHLSFYKMLVKPVSNFDKRMLEEIRNYRRQFRRNLDTFGPSKNMKANSTGISKVLTPLFNYWLECMKSCGTDSINEIVFEVVKLAQCAGSIFAAQSIKTCKCTLNTCKAKKNFYEEISTLQKCGTFICMFETKNLSKDLLNFTRDFIVEGIEKLREYKSTNCGLYSSLWNACGQIIYNVSLVASMDFLDQSAEMFSNLCSFIIREDGVKSTNKFLRCSNPLSLVLHKLSGVYFRAEKYREAMIVTAFNGLISYDEVEMKAFKMWANIKHKCKSEEMIKQTMIACLKADKAAIKEIGVEVKLDDYDLIKLCAREIQGLQKAKVNLTPAIKASLKELDSLQHHTMEFVEGVQLLGYHVLHFRDDCSIMEYIKKAESYLHNNNNNKSSVYNSCVKANLEFFKFMDRLNATSRKIKKDMKNTKNILQKGKNEIKIHDQTIETEEVVPVYRMINMKQDTDVISHLEQVLQKWENCFMKDPREIINCWEPQITLNIIIIAGEIARLYLSQSCEKRAWVLACELASTLGNHSACLYVTARSISLRYINDLWIEKAHGYAETLKNSEETDDKSGVGMFWISLADFYFEKGQQKEAVKLLNSVKNLGTIGFANDVPVYLDFMDTVVRNYKFYSEDLQHEEYSEYIVHHLYSMISVNEILNTGGKRAYYGLNTLFDAVNHVSLVMHSFISFREISAHLTLRLELAQSLGVTLRVAECLKSLCFIDLSRLKLDDCEVKLQGLEQILDVEGFGLSMKNKCPDASIFPSNTILTSRHMDVDDPLRDVIQNEASPILRKKIFIPPEFMLHEICNCYRCENIPYQYLVFSSTHIRAQVYALKDYSSVALQHFHGAFEVRRKLLEKEESRILKESQNSMKRHPWQKYYSMIDFVLFLLDFSKFIMGYKIPRVREAMEIALEAVNICKVYNLETHPVYFAAEELIFQYRFQNLNGSIHAFTVPDVADIDISDLVPAETAYTEKEKAKPCFTPCHSTDLPLKALRRKKTPPLLPLTKVSMSLSDSEDEDYHPSKFSRRKPPRKRILSLDDDSSSDEAVIKPDSKTTMEPKILVVKTEPLEEKFKQMSIQSKSSESIISSFETLISKVKNLKLENFQKTPMFAFSEEESEILKFVLDEKELQDVIQSIEELKLFNSVLENSSNLSTSSRTLRTRSKIHSSTSEDKDAQTFEKNIIKIVNNLTSAICRRKMSNLSIAPSEEKSLKKNVESGSSKSRLNFKSLDPSRPSSPDLFPSDDETVQIHGKVNINTKIRKSKAKFLSVDAAESSEGKRITRSRSVKSSSDSESVELNAKKVSRIPRKKT